MDIRELYMRQHQRVYRLAMLYLKNPQDAEDAVQNIFMKAWQLQKTFDSEEFEKAWCITVTRNYCKDVLKSFWRKRVDYQELPEKPLQQEDSPDILAEVMELPEKYREVIYMYYYEGFSVKEIAGVLNRKASTVQTQLMDARKKLKKMMESEV